MSKKKGIISELDTKQLFWIVLSVLIAVLPHITRMPVWFVPMTVAVVAYRFYSQIHNIGRTVNAIIMLITILTLMLLVYTQGFGLSREISVSVLISMTVLKLLETYRFRDAYLTVILCYFVVMTRFLYTQDLALVFYLITSVFATTHTLRVIHGVKSQRLVNRNELKLTGKLFAGAIPFAIVFFLIFPRIGSPIWGSPDIFGEGKTGISDTMSPGSIAQLFADDSPAFRATFKGTAPPPNELYWRGPVLWHFDGLTWTRQKHSSLNQTKNVGHAGRRIEYDVELEGTGQNYLFGLDYVSKLQTDAFILPDLILYSPRKINQIKHYTVESLLVSRYQEDLKHYHRNLLLALPEGYNHRTREMIKQWLQDTPTQEGMVQRALRLFSDQGFYYSFTPPELSGDTVDQFLFDTREGFCEHYASAFVVMMRMAGIPARVVTGYQGGINNGGYYLIRQSDAHAWAEVYLNEKEWVRVDPTAMVSPDRVERGTSAILDAKRGWFDFAWLRKTREGYDTFRYKWNQWVRSYNVNSQQAFFELLGFGHMDGKKIAIIITIVMLLTGFLIGLWFFIFKRTILSPQQKLLKRYRKLFKELPATQAVGNDVEHITAEVVQYYPELETMTERFTGYYNRARYGQPDKHSGFVFEQCRKILQQLRDAKPKIQKIQ
ncbi:transglutaminaseTgpA domain-containing protein [Marinicella sp. W31]|uniref:transglutaminase family protein n=1 Tax=Marinicella sp. W31 TaxID=3023713 RepID=UPI003756B115